MDAMVGCQACCSCTQQHRRESPRLVRPPTGFCEQLPTVVYVPVPVYTAQQCQKCERSFCIVCGQRGSLGESKSGENRRDNINNSSDKCQLHQADMKYAAESNFHGPTFMPCFEKEAIHADSVEQCTRCGQLNMVDGAKWLRPSSADFFRRPHPFLQWEHGSGRWPKTHVASCPYNEPTPSCGNDEVRHSNNERRENEVDSQYERKATNETRENNQTAQPAAKASSTKTQRRLSADSGRITWSDSGESAFSDFQAGDWNHKASTPRGRGTTCSSKESEVSYAEHHGPSTSSQGQLGKIPDSEEKTPKTPGFPHDTKSTRQERSQNRCQQKAPNSSPMLLTPNPPRRPAAEGRISHSGSIPHLFSPAVESAATSGFFTATPGAEEDEGLIFSFKIPARGEFLKKSNSTHFHQDGCAKLIMRQQNHAKSVPKSAGIGRSRKTSTAFGRNCATTPLPEDAPTRSKSDILLTSSSKCNRRTSLSSTPSPYTMRAQLSDCTLERPLLSQVAEGDQSPPATPPRKPRPRSKSLFVVPQSQRKYWKEDEALPTILHEEAPSFQFQKPDFTSWTSLATVREIQGDKGSKEGIKAYGITGLISQQGIAVTDSDKVRIKMYDICGELKHSFGTPTWPRYGRGIAVTKCGHIAVCHLTEVCVYSTEGKLITRYQKDEFNSCWGIACDMKGNFVVTDPKSSSVFILNGDGDIVEQIGRRGPSKGPTVNSCKGRRKSTSNWKSNLSLKAFRSSRKRTQTAFEPKLNSQSDSIRRLSNLSLSPIDVKEESISAHGGCNKRNVRLLAPRYVAVNSKNQILVTDTKQRCLLVFEQNGKLLFSIGGGRIGCKECSKGRRPGRKSLGSSMEFVDIVQRASLPENLECVGNDQSPEKKAQREKGYNLLYDICNRDICSAKQERVRVLGTMYRGDMARNESVESEAYMKRSAPDGEAGCEFMGKGSEPPPDSPSSAVGSRLQNNDGSPREECSSYIELPMPRKQEKSIFTPLSKLTRKISRRISESKSPLWVRRRNRKQGSKATKPENMLCVPLDECHSLESYEEGMDGSDVISPAPGANAPASPLATLRLRPLDILHSPDKSLPATPKSACTKGQEEKGHIVREVFLSPDDSLEDSRTAYSFNVNEYSVISFETDSEEYWDGMADCSPEENEQRTACRRCHVEDPRGVCVDENDNILLVDRARNRVTVFTPQGHFVRHILTEDDGLTEPMAVAVLHDASLALIDSSSTIKIFKFSSDA